MQLYQQFSTRDYRYLDHAYCTTLHKAQGQTVDQVMLAADSENSLLNKTESLYVALTRARYDAHVYGDQEMALIRQFEQGQEKTSTLGQEVFGLEDLEQESLRDRFQGKEFHGDKILGQDAFGLGIGGQEPPGHNNEPSALDQVLREHLAGLSQAEPISLLARDLPEHTSWFAHDLPEHTSWFGPAGPEQSPSPALPEQGHSPATTAAPLAEHEPPGLELSLEP